MNIVLAHDPAGLLAAFLGVMAAVLFGIPLVNSLLAAAAFMLSGIGAGVAWWRRILAPGLYAVCSFVLVGLCLLLLGAVTAEGPTPLWVKVVFCVIWGVHLLLPFWLSRGLLRFCLWRALLATLLVPVLHVVLALLCGYGLHEAWQEIEKANAERQKQVEAID